MKSYVRAIVLTAAATATTLIFAYTVGGANSPRHDVADDHFSAAATVSATTGNHEGHHEDGDSQVVETCVLLDLYTYAQHHLGEFTTVAGSFGGTTAWSGQWDLHWLDVQHDGHTVRIYHLTHREDPHLRYVWMWRSGNLQPTSWEEVH